MLERCIDAAGLDTIAVNASIAAVLEAPTVYGDLFDHRSVDEVARYFGFSSGAYRVVDISKDLRPLHFERGLVEQTISSTWVDADLRIVM